MKKILIILGSILTLTGCNNKDIEIKENNIDFTCIVNENNYLICDNEHSIYDEHNNLIVITSKNGSSETYNYEYDENGNVISIRGKNSQKILITYNNEMNLDTITIIANPDMKEAEQSKSRYEFIYENGNLVKITNSFSFGEKDYAYIIDSNITYNYYKENNIDYVEETTSMSNKKIIRTFKLENMKKSNNILQLINYVPNIYYYNLKYYPYYSLESTNYQSYHDLLLFIPIIESFSIINADGKVNTINYYYDSNNRFITDSENRIINRFVDENENKISRYTIYEKTLGKRTYFYKYKIEYIYKDKKLVNFIKYDENEISKKEFDRLKLLYLQNINI